MDLVLATLNPGKITEIREVLNLRGLALRTFEDFSSWPDMEETGDTLEENAIQKAKAVGSYFALPALADDSGLLVDYLGGAPGVHSSRYAGPEGDSDRNMELLLRELGGVPEERRTARFLCLMVLVLPDGETPITRGACEGTILAERRGRGGFGYDPVFRPEGFDRSMAELSLEEKNALSHRGKALRAMKEVLEDLLGSGL